MNMSGSYWIRLTLLLWCLLSVSVKICKGRHQETEQYGRPSAIRYERHELLNFRDFTTTLSIPDCWEIPPQYFKKKRHRGRRAGV